MSAIATLEKASDEGDGSELEVREGEDVEKWVGGMRWYIGLRGVDLGG